MKNIYGSAVTLTIFGESHGPAVGVVVGGLAPGIPVNAEFMAAELDKRRAAGGISTGRQEADKAEIISGVYNGFTTGTPLCIQIRNENLRSADYARSQNLLRPGHADYTAREKYLGFEDPRGGGHFSARLTAPLVAAGAIFREILAFKNIVVGTQLASCAGIEDTPLPENESQLRAALHHLNQKYFATLNDAVAQEMQAAIIAAKEEKDSVGGVLKTAVAGLPPGIGEPFFGSVESVIAGLFFSIPAVKAVEFGIGTLFAGLRGSAANDQFVLQGERVGTKTNNNGGINGGITNGMPLIIKTTIKPTPSIARGQNTLNWQTKTEERLFLQGRHDPCVLHRARAVADALAAFALVDLLSMRFGTLWQQEEYNGKI